MSVLGAELDRYLALRRSLGFQLQNAEPLLRSFVAYLERHKARYVTTALALDWARAPRKADPSWWAARLGHVRVFSVHLHARDTRHERVPQGLLRAQSRRAIPYLYLEGDVVRLMQAAAARHTPLTAQTYTTLVGLLAVTGMRVGEAIRLDRRDLDLKHRWLLVRNSKFNRSRYVPLHETSITALRRYHKVRDRLCPQPKSSALLLSSRGTRLIYKNVQFAFSKLVQQTGIKSRNERCRPRLHDMRHSFAVRTMLDWYRADVDVEAWMPRLSTYLGHVEPASTYWYLSAAPELLSLAAQRLGRLGGSR